MNTPLLLKDRNCDELVAVVKDNAYYDRMYADIFIRAQAAVNMECEAHRILRQTGSFTPEDLQRLKVKYPLAA